MSRFHLELDDRERMYIVTALCESASRNTGMCEALADLAIRLMNLAPLPSGGDGQAVTSSAPAPVDSPLSAPAPKPQPKEELGELVITPVKIDQPTDGKSMVVHYRFRASRGTILTKVHCWDPSQFGTILATLNQSTTFLTKTTSKGFINIVGVKR